MKKAVFFDIDGTLWNEHMQVPESTVRAVRQLRENGHYAFICSGRSRSNIRNEKLLGIGFDGVVAACGTHIDFHAETVFEKLLTKEQVEFALGVLKKHGIPAVLEGPEHIYVNPEDFQDDPFVLYLRKELGEDLCEIHEDVSKIVINKISVGINGADVKKVEKELGSDFDMIVHEDAPVAEIIPKDFSKATGIEKVCELLKISHENTYAFGDSENDLSMLQFVAHGIAMGNGTKNAKAAAEYVTSDLEEDGILNGLLHYGLIS